ncbi:energy-coupling factor transporter transmembrane protein EcfT [Haloferax mediterranei ATCC 33500]|uniref:Cobalt ABC transporter permease n=1 Tax=Haloferax mediterranei (strain ATCC 33500 / DSM 1411 / JCM 8866 / NBRC 14739 / NCIMB 2177 / R-4) TaxID=523841 RepID=I3R151_HALMT|nr:energy-coupling factor transporter transmembrane protein EcfT [Haloferax mediterranei]AFK17961.1 cobalt transport protein [Haloferax mediterranei ATCC 33500]AHZ22617.1 cobalt ABC transporter permease [Haloferax mediterranei ATCC 33500]EMA02761.1 cobalt transport protein [Haloferax mediterranei ATCC 33500]MDX5988054.1 energy-coupling factor transporter transmembrane protein EcfT [Haloferax mediterranei ATCC 33500]QCQ74513.1 energy-coupling factor transporter transmembrane protein EcfT [Halof
MLTYEPGDSLAHRLDPRTKLAVQMSFAAAGFAHTTPVGLTVLGVVAAVCLRAADTAPFSALYSLRYAIPFLAVGPIVEAARLSSPWFEPAAAVDPALASIRVMLVFLVAAAYVRTTPVRESRAAIQRLVPGRFGVALGVGVALVFRFLPLVRRDLLRVREAQAARLGDERRLDERLSLVAAGGLRRSFARADALALALRARCFAWNPTLPVIRLGRRDVPGVVLALALLSSTIV